jgi:hypothetical protein
VLVPSSLHPLSGYVSRTPLYDMFGGAQTNSSALAAAFTAAGERTSVPVFDAARVTPTDGMEGVHLTAEDHGRLGICTLRRI